MINDAVKIRLRSDTGKAIAISSGVDSSTIADIVVNKLKENVNLINIDHEVYRKDTEENDSPDIYLTFR